MQLVNETIKNPSGWDSSSNYMGQTEFSNFYTLITQNRDSDTVTRSNFISALVVLGGESENVEIHRFGHWACGWWELIAVKADSREHLEALDIEKRLKDYPVVNEEHLCELEFNEASDYWASCSIQERIDYCKEHDISIFSSRYKYLPQDDNGSLLDALTRN